MPDSLCSYRPALTSWGSEVFPPNGQVGDGYGGVPAGLMALAAPETNLVPVGNGPNFRALDISSVRYRIIAASTINWHTAINDWPQPPGISCTLLCNERAISRAELSLANVADWQDGHNTSALLWYFDGLDILPTPVTIEEQEVLSLATDIGVTVPVIGAISASLGSPSVMTCDGLNFGVYLNSPPPTYIPFASFTPPRFKSSQVDLIGSVS